MGLDTESERRVGALEGRIKSALWPPLSRNNPLLVPQKTQHWGVALGALKLAPSGPWTIPGTRLARTALPPPACVTEDNAGERGCPQGLLADTGAVAVPSSHLCSTAEVVIVNLFNGLEVDNTLQLCLMFICPREGTVVARG